MKEIGERIKSLLRQKGKSVAELADYLNLHRATVYGILNGTISLSLERALQIAEFLGVEISDLVYGPQTVFMRNSDQRMIELIRQEVDRIIEERLKEERKKHEGPAQGV